MSLQKNHFICCINVPLQRTNLLGRDMPRPLEGCSPLPGQAVGTGAGLCCAMPWANISARQRLPRGLYGDGARKRRQQRGVMYRGSARAGIKTCAPATTASSALRCGEGHLVLVASSSLLSSPLFSSPLMVYKRLWDILPRYRCVSSTKDMTC